MATSLAAPARATWSIVAVDFSTGEVCVATATCLSLDIQPLVPMIRVGIGAAATQSIVFPPDKVTIWDAWTAGLTPEEILALLGGNAAQYGIVNIQGKPVTFTGQSVGSGKHGVAGKTDTIRYAIQGNVLTGKDVVNKARFALVNTPGDLGQRVMAAMEAAREFGGDGRCSCDATAPTSCGSPPASFTKTAHTGTILLARIGDTDGPCTPNGGCVQGDYYLNLNFPGQPNDPDPVFVLQSMYDQWRADLAGRPDHLLSTKKAAPLVPADGKTAAKVRVQLVDVDGVPLTSGGATLEVEAADPAAPPFTAGPVFDHGDGSYTVSVVAGTTTGVLPLAITADDGTARAQLYPPVELELEPPAAMHVGYERVPATGGVVVPLTLDLGAAHAGDRYALLVTKSGTSPGTSFGGVPVPINVDALTTAAFAGGSFLRNTFGGLDADGRASAAFVANATELSSLVGLRLDFAAVSLGPTPAVTNADGFSIVP